MGQPKQALDKYMEIYTDSINTSDLKSTLWSCSILCSFFERQGDHINSDKYQLEYYRTKEAIESSGLGKSIHELDLRRNIDNFGKKLADANEKNKRNRFIILIGGLICLIIIISLLFFIWYANKRRHYIMTLYEKNQQIAKVKESHVDYTKVDSSQNEDSTDDVPSEKEIELERAVVDVLENSNAVYNPEFQLSSLCAAVGSNPTYVSKAVSRHYDKSFKTVLTELRVKEACRRFDNPSESSLYTVEAICREIGFKSRATFSVAFKNITGLTPTEYRAAAKKYSPSGER